MSGLVSHPADAALAALRHWLATGAYRPPVKLQLSNLRCRIVSLAASGVSRARGVVGSMLDVGVQKMRGPKEDANTPPSS